MKKFVATVALLAGAASIYSQGQVNYSDYNPGATTGFNIHIWSPGPADPTVEVSGNSTTPFTTSPSGLVGDAPTGTVNPGYTGQLIGGAGTPPGSATLDYADGDSFDVELYAAAGNTVAAGFFSLSPIPGTLCHLADASFGGAYAGMYFGTGNGLVTLDGTGGTPVVPGGSPATFALACWFNGGGTYPTLAAAVAGVQPWAFSPLGTENVGGGTVHPPFLPGLGDPNTLAGGITSFSIVLVPEPSTLALFVIGASASLMSLRRKVGIALSERRTHSPLAPQYDKFNNHVI